MLIKKNISLKSYNTFGVDVNTKYFVEILNVQQLKDVVDFSKVNNVKILILGGGSNILFTKNVDGLLLKNCLLGKKVVKETDDFIFLKVHSGEEWPALVDYCVEQGWGGAENLSLIPGSVGAAPVQNIGAYGVEVKDIIQEVEAFDLQSGEIVRLSNDECEFGYRISVFKTSAKGRYFVLSVTFKLLKNPVAKLEYAPLKMVFNEHKQSTVSINEISEAVKQIRRSKLPDPVELGNAGSFFKNPVVTNSFVVNLKQLYPDMPVYKMEDNMFKLAAGWLIEQTGWKGKRIGNAGVYEKQALVLVNYGGASGENILNLAKEIRKEVLTKFDVKLDFEVNII